MVFLESPVSGSTQRFQATTAFLVSDGADLSSVGNVSAALHLSALLETALVMTNPCTTSERFGPTMLMSGSAALVASDTPRDDGGGGALEGAARSPGLIIGLIVAALVVLGSVVMFLMLRQRCQGPQLPSYSLETHENDDGIGADGREIEVAALPAEIGVQTAISTFSEVLTFADTPASQAMANDPAEAAEFVF
jgi:hypothetical protein